MKDGNNRNISVKKLIAWLWASSRGTRKQAFLNTGIGLADVISQLLWVLACKHAIDIATGTADGSLTFTAIAISVLMLMQIISRAASRWIHSVTGNKVRNRMRRDAFARLLRCDWLHLQRHHTGDLTNRLEGDVSSITSLMTEVMPATVVSGIQLLASFLLLFMMSPMLAVAVLTVLPVCLLASRIYVKKMRSLNRDVRNSDSRIQSVLQESLQHKELIKSLEQNISTENQLTQLQTRLQRQIASRTKFSLGAYTIIQLGFAIGYVIAFIWGVNSLRDGLITYGTMAAYLQLVSLIQRPTMDLSRYLPGIVSSLTAAERLYELEEMPMEQQGEAIMFEGTAGVCFKNVRFRYEEGKRFIFENFTYDFPPNSSTAIVGETGAGKTTLIRLLIALINPLEGEIRLYNESGSENSSTLTRCNFVYIPQGNSLVSGTIRENLLVGNPEASDEQMKEALNVAAADFVEQMPLGLETQCFEKGAGLSEGQAQRIAIARALLRPGKVLLLDEFSSALDAETEEVLMERLTSHMPDRTMIFITHRERIVDFCSATLRLK